MPACMHGIPTFPPRSCMLCEDMAQKEVWKNIVRIDENIENMSKVNVKVINDLLERISVLEKTNVYQIDGNRNFSRRIDELEKSDHDEGNEYEDE